MASLGIRRFFSDLFSLRRDELAKVATMAALFFLVVGTIGIMKPIKNALALGGLGSSGFFKVYLISAAVVVFVPPYNRLANRVPWRWLIPAVAVFFALNLLLFRAFYQEGSAAYGIAFYGWYDLYAAVMVTQFFMASQLFFNAREAKRLYPFAIMGGSIGAVSGSAITGFFAQAVGIPNLLLVAALFIAVFAVALPIVWAAESRRMGAAPQTRREDKLTAGEFRTIIGNPHVRLIAAAVLLTVLVKQLVDYQFNALSFDIFETTDATTAFFGKFFAATQWLPLVVLVALRPILARWGVGVVVLLLPLTLLVGNLALAVSWSLLAAIFAKASDGSFRYTAERAGREILYVPVPDNIKLKAKAYIDVAVEKGLGKVLSAALIFALLFVIDYRQVGYVGVALAVVWVGVIVAVKREYVRTLARSIRGRFASFEGVFASIADPGTASVVEQALVSGDDRQASFALDLIEQADPGSARRLAASLNKLLDSGMPRVRERALAALSSFPEAIDYDKVRDRVADPVESVRRAAVRLLCTVDSGESAIVIRDLLESDVPAVRMAALACIAEGDGAVDGRGLVDESYLERRLKAAQNGDVAARMEAALAAGALGDDSRVPEILGPLLRDPDPEVKSVALQAAGIAGRREFLPRMILALGPAATREAARDALLKQGERVEGTLSDYLDDSTVEAGVRRNIPAVMARIPAQATVEDLLRGIESRPSDPILYYRALKALSKIRARAPELTFDQEQVLKALEREAQASAGHKAARAALESYEADSDAVALLRRGLLEAWSAGRERVFRFLGLIYPQNEMYRSYLTLEGGTARIRANALEYLEQTIGHNLFERLAPAIQEGEVGDDRHGDIRQVFGGLWTDDNVWLASSAAWAAADLKLAWVGEELEKLGASVNRDVALVARIALARLEAEGDSESQPGSGEMNLIEKVFLLQQVDLLQDARSEDLALLASIAEEMEAKAGTVLVRQDEPTDALYIVIHGAVELRRAGEPVLTAEDGTPFGTWALIDEAPSLIDATAVEDTQLLRITRQDFYDLLADYQELVRGLLQGLARRVRALVA